MKILILTHFFPPLEALASRRPYSWARAWADEGHEVHVVTAEKYAFDGSLTYDVPCDGFAVHPVSYAGRIAGRASAARTAGSARWKSVKRITRSLRQRASMFADPRLAAVPALFQRACAIAASRPLDLVVSTYAPASPHLAASRVASRTRVPWVADYQDLWTNNYLDVPGRVRRSLVGSIERRVVRDASMLFTLSHGLATHLHALLRKPCGVAYFGYEETSAEAVVPDDGRLHFAYTGRVWADHQPVAILFTILRRALASRPSLDSSVVIDFYGPEQRPLQEMARLAGVESVTRFHGEVSRDVARAVQRGASANVLLDWFDEGATGVLPAKLFEYLDSGRPVVAFSHHGESEAAAMVDACRAGCVLRSDEALLRFFMELPDSLPRVERDYAHIAELSSRKQAQEMIRTIRRTLAL